MIKHIKFISIALLITIVGIVGFSIVRYSPEYMYRIVKYGESDVQDYNIFSNTQIKKSNKPKNYSYKVDNRMNDMEMTYSISDKMRTTNLDTFLSATNTTSFIVVHNNSVVFEKYYNGYSKNSINTSFSSAKSMVSLLIGIAIEDGYIKSEDETIENFIEELKGSQIGEITIKELLSMRSPIKYHEGSLWFGDDAKTYYIPNLRKLAIKHTKIDSQYKGNFHYNNYHPLLLGIIIERSTGKSVASYFEEKIWDKIGSEYDASWSIDSLETQFEKMESGLNFRAIDFAKIGSMLINNGKWNNNQIVSQDWIAISTITEFPLSEEDYKGSFLENRETGYQYMWYSTMNDKNGIDYYAAGKYGQYLYISPEHNTVIVRTGIHSGHVNWYPDILKEIASKVNDLK